MKGGKTFMQPAMLSLCALAAAFAGGWNISADAAGKRPANKTVYVDDIDQWRVEVFAGAANPHGFIQGPRLEAGFGRGGSMCFLPSGEGFMASAGVVMILQRNGTIRWLAGVPGLYGAQDGPVTRATLGRQLSISLDGRDGLYLGDRSNRCIRRLFKKDNRWTVATVAGDPTKPEWRRRPVDGTGRAAIFKYLHSNIIADKDGNAYIMDRNFLRRITPAGKVETLNPKGGPGKPDDAPLETARFNLIMGGGMCFGPDGNIYVADRWNHCIRKVDLTAKRVTVAVGPGRGYRDGPEKACGFHDSPGHIVYDAYRNRFNTNGVDDWGVRVWEKGFMRTIAGGNRRNKGFAGPAKQASLHWAGTRGIDPRPPHDIYFYSGKMWQGRLGRLYKVSAEKKGGAQ